MERNIFTTVAIAIMCLFLASCNSVGNMNRTQNVSADSDAVEDNETGYGIDEWEKDPTLGRVQPGIYKRIGIVKKDETYEEMLKLRDIENKGYLTVNDDGTATFELDGEKTEYVYDEFNLYPGTDAKETIGIPYVFIGGRMVVNDGSTVTQYLKLSDEELEDYIKTSVKTEDPDR